MKKTTLRLLCTLTLLLLFLTQCSEKTDNSYRFRFKFISENYKPLNFIENAQPAGLAPELLKQICGNLDIPFEVTFLDWEQAYNQAQTTNNAVLFTTILNADRQDLFKWAGPFASLDWMFYSSSSNYITVNTMDDARSVAAIGVIRDYSIEQFLISEGFTNLVYCDNNIDAFDKLLKGEIDLFPSDKITAEAALESLGQSIYKVTGQLTIRTDLLYFAFNKSIPDDVVADFQREINLLKENGSLRTLYRKYMQSSDVPGTLQIYTEQYPPLTFRNNQGDLTGFGVDVASEIMKRNQIFADIRLTLWSNAYELALHNPDFCLFTMDRTPARDTLFQWVGPIGTNTTFFYVKNGSGITISSIDDARNLASVGTVSFWFSDQYLREQGFTNLVSDSDPKIMTEKLMQGEIDAFVCTSVTFPDILKDLGYEYAQVQPAFSLLSSDYYIAFSKNTPVSMVNLWQSTFESLKQDGTYQAIQHKWFP